MAIDAQYSKEVRTNLSYFPCWEPGDKVSPGDVGELIKGVFHLQTTLGAMFPELQVKIGHDAKPNRSSFQSENSVSFQFKPVVAVPGGGPAGAVGSVEITFSRGGAVVFQAANCSRRFIENLHETREYIASHLYAWPKGYAFVSHVEDAESFVVFVSSGAGESVSLDGKLEMLQQFKLAEGSVSAASVQNIGYQRMSTGPILLRLYGPGFWGGIKLLAGGEGKPEGLEGEVPELSARDPVFD